MDDEYSTAHRSRFRFKSKSKSKRHISSPSRSKSPRGLDGSRDDADEPSSRHRRHRHHHRRHRHPSSNRHEPSSADAQPPGMNPDDAFRESLFDALADDEGAQYWESVYGQPIHTYPRPEKGGQGVLEQMTDEEYAEYVRARMWEKTHEAVFEERERRRREREKERERKGNGVEGEREAFERMVEESLRRGRERKGERERRDRWIKVWRRYLDSWEVLDGRAREVKLGSKGDGGGGGGGGGETDAGQGGLESKDSGRAHDHGDKLRNLIFWPVESGKRRDISPQAVEAFVRHAPVSTPACTPAGAPAGLERQQQDQAGKARLHASDILTVLKIERVRWHPDKMQHRYGALGMEEQLVKSATEVFQILDRMWVEERERRGNGVKR
ncbi:hypothetical protein AJ79_05775 [Helicocarpus griseus UAMH5409]|uniref:Uncharacterized protein n=1 Tax=Helicocarpus griseus UAMH5409 TaxID=1447875 RepID=A0A2B7XIU7_9EURO|nr:hypothetical protein AJ79_05775 [Helicocarpus griseus UAMH5409]